MAGDYHIEVANFGPIVEASLDIRPLTVFLGPSDTGKSYLAILLYALHQCFGGLRPPLGLTFFERLSMNPDGGRPPLPNSVTNALQDWIRSLFGPPLQTAHPRPVLPLPTPIPPEVVAHLRQILERHTGLDQRLWQQVSRCFGTDGTEALVRAHGSQSSATVAFVIESDRDRTARYRFRLGAGTPELAGDITIPDPSELSVEDVRQMDTNVRQLRNPLLMLEPRAFFDSLADHFFASMLQPLVRHAYYLPADRTGMVHNHHMIVSALLQGASTGGLRAVSPPTLSGVLADFVDRLLWIDRPALPFGRPPQPRSTELDRLVAGSIRVTANEAGYPTFTYQPEGWDHDLPLFRSSSMVSELAPVILYMRYVVRQGDVLIIEEPEAHLHPAKQTEFAREIARMVHAGIRVVITTHSEWFVEQIGNLVRASDLPADRRAGIAAADVALKPRDVGVWLFKPRKRPRGSVVEQVKLDEETGLFPTDYDEVSQTLYNEGAAIFNRLQA